MMFSIASPITTTRSSTTITTMTWFGRSGVGWFLLVLGSFMTMMMVAEVVQVSAWSSSCTLTSSSSSPFLLSTSRHDYKKSSATLLSSQRGPVLDSGWDNLPRQNSGSTGTATLDAPDGGNSGSNNNNNNNDYYYNSNNNGYNHNYDTYQSPSQGQQQQPQQPQLPQYQGQQPQQNNFDDGSSYDYYGSWQNNDHYSGVNNNRDVGYDTADGFTYQNDEQFRNEQQDRMNYYYYNNNLSPPPSTVENEDPYYNSFDSENPYEPPPQQQPVPWNNNDEGPFPPQELQEQTQMIAKPRRTMPLRPPPRRRRSSSRLLDLMMTPFGMSSFGNGMMMSTTTTTTPLDLLSSSPFGLPFGNFPSAATAMMRRSASVMAAASSLMADVMSLQQELQEDSAMDLEQLFMDANVILNNNPDAIDLLGSDIRIEENTQPLSQSSSMVSINGQQQSRMDVIVPVTGAQRSGLVEITTMGGGGGEEEQEGGGSTIVQLSILHEDIPGDGRLDIAIDPTQNIDAPSFGNIYEPDNVIMDAEIIDEPEDIINSEYNNNNFLPGTDGNMINANNNNNNNDDDKISGKSRAPMLPGSQ